MFSIQMPQRTTLILAALGFLSSIFLVNTAWSQALPPAGDVNKALQPQPLKPDADPLNLPKPAPATATQTVGEKVLVKGFRFTGNSVLKDEELNDLVKGFINQELDIASFSKVAEAVTLRYRSLGYSVARAMIPAQKSTDGVVQIAILEGRLSAINLVNTSPIRDERLRLATNYGLCSAASCEGIMLRDENLARAVLLLRDTPGITTTTNFKAGSKPTSTDIDLEVRSTKLRAYSLGTDNFGSPATGTTRVNANADFNNLRNDGDQLSLGIATTTMTATKTGSASYTMPVGYSGQRVGFGFSRNQYRLGAGFSATQSNGLSNALIAFTSYPFIRGVTQSLYGRLSGELRNAVNRVDISATSFKTNANVVRAGLAGDSLDSAGGGGFNLYGLTVSTGYTGTTDAGDATGAKTAGRFTKLNYNLSRQQNLSGPWSLFGGLNGQRAVKNLDGSEQTGLGGPFSVRGYGGEAGGSTGASGTMELRYTQPLKLGKDPAAATYAFFVDRGWVQYYQIAPSTATGEPTRALSSWGLTYTLQSQPAVQSANSWGYFVRAMAGRHSMAQPSAVDAASKGKFWLQAGVNF